MNVDNVSILAKAELKENPIPIKPNHHVEYFHCLGSRIISWNWGGYCFRILG